MTVNQLSLELMIEVGEDTSNTSLVSQFETWTNDAYVKVVSSSRFFYQNKSEPIATVVGQKIYTLASDAEEVRAIVNVSTDLPLSYEPVEDLIRLGLNLEASGTPETWYYEGANSTTNIQVGLYPVPSTIITYNYHELKRPDTLATGATIPLSVTYIKAMKMYVRALVAFNDGDTDLHDRVMGEFDNEIGKLVARFGTPVSGQSLVKAGRQRAIRQAPAASNN
jgi:hypothetical protein